MATKIRLARGGAKKRPHYSIVVADSRAPRDGRFIEKIGTYNPMVAENRVNLKTDRIEHWLKAGAVPTERVALFITAAGLGKDNSNIATILKKREKTIKLKAEELKRKKEEEARKAAEEAAAAKKAEEEAAAAAAAAATAEEAPAA